MDTSVTKGVSRYLVFVILTLFCTALWLVPVMGEEPVEETDGVITDENVEDKDESSSSSVYVRPKEQEAVEFSDADLKKNTQIADSYKAVIYGNEDWDDVGPAVDDEYGGLSVKDYNALVRMTYAEAGGEGEEGMLLVANVILNRMKSYKYPVTVSAVISQTGQFQPYANGRYSEVEPDAAAVRAVKRALSGENNAPGVLYFKSVHSNAVWSHKEVAFRYKNHIFYY